MRIWSILFIISDLKWCMHLSRSLYLYRIYNFRHGRCMFEKFGDEVKKERVSLLTRVQMDYYLPIQKKSRKYQGVAMVKSRVKKWQVRGIWFQQKEHKQVPKRGRNQVSARVSSPCWHVTPVENTPWQPLLIR